MRIKTDVVTEGAGAPLDFEKLEVYKELEDRLQKEREEMIRDHTAISKQLRLEEKYFLYHPKKPHVKASTRASEVREKEASKDDEAKEEEGEQDDEEGEEEDEEDEEEEEEEEDEEEYTERLRIEPGETTSDLYAKAMMSAKEPGFKLHLPPIDIKNVVFTVFASKTMNLNEIVANNPFCWYNPEVFAAMQTKIRDHGSNLNATLLIFSSGKIVVTGLEMLKQAEIMYMDTLPRLFNQHMKLDIKLDRFVIQNIVARSECVLPDGQPFALDIQAIREASSCRVSYTDDLFPGLIYPMEDPNLMALLFKSGKIVLTGAKTYEDLKRGLFKLYHTVCLRYAIQPNVVSTSSVYSLSSRRSTDLYRNTINELNTCNGNEEDVLRRFREAMHDLKDPEESAGSGESDREEEEVAAEAQAPEARPETTQGKRKAPASAPKQKRQRKVRVSDLDADDVIEMLRPTTFLEEEEDDKGEKGKKKKNKSKKGSKKTDEAEAEKFQKLRERLKTLVHPSSLIAQ